MFFCKVKMILFFCLNKWNRLELLEMDAKDLLLIIKKDNSFPSIYNISFQYMYGWMELVVLILILRFLINISLKKVSKRDKAL